MITKKKIVSAVLALMFILLPLAGCVRTELPAADETAAPLTEAPPAAKTDEPTGEPPVSPTAPAQTEEITPGSAPTEAPAVSPTPAPVEEPTAAPTSAPTTAPTPTAAPTQAPMPTATPKPTAAPTAPPAGTPDFSVFDNCCFVGNSTFEGLHLYHVIDNGAWYTRVGLNVNTVYTTPTEHGSVPIIDELNHGSYEGVLLMFGQNECGWPSLDTFLNKYRQLVEDVHARQPGAKVFLTGVPPVSQHVSDTSPYGVTNPHISYINSGLEAIAGSIPYAHFITVPSELIGPGGALPAEASSDGIHLNKTYLGYWANHICRSAEAVLK